MKGKIQIHKVCNISQIPPPLDGYVYINALSWFKNNVITINETKIPMYEVSPYYLKDENGY